jgi:UDPglucose 6-dehydrogenase
VLIGSSTTASGKRAAEALAGIYASWVPRSRIITTNVWSSELSKLVANSMLAQRISSINSISAICEKTGADIDEVAGAIGYDPRIGSKFLKAGIGFGGSCFKKDILSLVYLAESFGLEEVGEYWRQVIKMNEYQRDRFSSRVIRCLNNTLVGKKLTVLGYAFKPNTSDTRESPALEVIKTLLEEGPREIAVFDPCCNPLVIQEEIRKLSGSSKALKEDGGPIVVYGNAYEACNASDAILITTEFDEFRNTKQTPSYPPGLASNNGGSRPHFAKPGQGQDPRPFERLDPTESDLLALHKHLVRSTPGGVSLGSSDDPLRRYHPEPSCAIECPDCTLERESEAAGYASGVTTEEYRPKERLDWAKITYHMRKPKWVFDGRGVIDAREMAKFGVRVESVGRQGRS